MDIDELTKLLSERNTECGKWFKECESLRAEVEQLRGNRITCLGAYCADWRNEHTRAISAEKSRDEAVAELNKALETLGQLRSDLQRVEDARDGLFELFRVCEEARANADFDGTVPDCIKYLDDRAQSAEASLAKLREVLGSEEILKILWSHLGHEYTAWPDAGKRVDYCYKEQHPIALSRLTGAATAIRSLLDAPDKGGANG